MAYFCSSNDKRNFQWVTVATLDLIKLPLKDILASQIKPVDLFQKILSCSTLMLRTDQRKLCLIQPPGLPDYNTFDVTLLYTLIRNLCGLPSPAQGWGKEPKATDTQISDDIERLRLFRNNYYAHANSASISDDVFEDVWRNLKLAIKRFNSKTRCNTDYEDELIMIERSKFTDDHLKTCRILLDALANIEKQTDSKDEPDISIKGENEKNCGETALFEANVEKVKSSSWTITWHKRRGDVIKCIDTSMERYSGSTKRKLVIKSVCKEDEGEYQAVLSLESNGPYYRSKNIIRLFVYGEVPSVKILVDSPVCFGSTTTIKSEVSSTPKPKKIEWQKSKDRIDFYCTEKPIYLRSTDIFTSPSYVIPKTTFTDKLYYRVLVWNEIGKGVSNTVYLDVTGSPPNIMTSFETNIKDRLVKLIGSMYFYDDSPGILETFWTKNEKKIDPEKSGGKLSEISNDTPSLTIRNVSPDDAGEYRLTATNAVGSSTSDVIVLGIPSIFLEKIEDKKNGGQRITVMIKSSPAPFHVQWSAKSKDDGNFTPIDINTEEYEGTTVSFPHPVLVVRHRDQIEKNCFKIEVTNFIGNTVQEISGENNPVVLSSTDNAEETPYNDHGASVRFTRLNNILADQFPPEKVEKLKFLLETSKKVKNQKSVLKAKSAMDCLRILQDEHLFTQKDVIFMQFLCRETDCLKLYAKCIEYAEKQKALCFFEKQSVNGYVDVQFHVQGDLSDYSKEFIQKVIETVAAILDCTEEDIQLNALRYSTSFFLSLSIKKVYIRKLLALKEQDRLNLKKLNIDYLKIDEETIHLNRGEDYIEKRKTMDICNIATTVRANMLFFWSFINQLPTILGSIVGCFIGWNLFYLGKIPVMNIVVMVIAIGLAILLIWYLGDFIWINIKKILFLLVVCLFCACAFLLSVILVFGEAVLIFFLVTLKKNLVNFDKMLHITSEEILTLISSEWIAIIAGPIVLCVFYWGKNLSHLQMNGKPNPFNVTHNSFEVRWNRPTFAFPSRYIVYVRNVTAPEVREYTTRGRECSMKVIDLSFNTKFVVSVRACIGILKWPIGDESDVITTKHLAFKMKSRSTLLQITQATPNSLPIYAVEYKVEKIDVEKIRRIMIGEAPNGGPNQNGKGILIFSTPHSGKTTLLQGIMNFIFGVSSTDNFRLCFAPELSNTSDLYQDWVTVYEFQEHEGGNLGYPLTIIDIPRIHGSKRKYIQTLHEQMNFLVNSYRTKIDCICFVAQANTSSFSSDQIKHIQSIKYLFETDSDMSCFFTFADLGPPPIKHILEVNNIAFNESFSVNCSCLFQTNEKSSDLFWKTNYDAFDKFFNHLQVSVSKSLRKNLHGPGDPSIPENRKELTSNIAVLYPEVRKDLAKLGDIKNQLKKFSNHKDEIMSTGDFSFTIEEITQTKKPLEPGMHVTNCMHCFCICHKNCASENDDKHQCIAMKDRYCTVCTDRCIWYFHENTPHIYIYDSVKVTKSYREMKSSYEAEKGEPLDYNEYLEHLNKDIEALFGRLHDKVTRMNKSGNELNGIPKSPLAGSFDATIDKMIAAEIRGKEMGFQQRIEMFQELKKYADFIRMSHPTDSNNVIYHI